MTWLEASLVALALAAAAATLAAFFATGVAPLSAPPAARRALLELLAPHADVLARGTVYDLGCGFGGTLFALARAHPAARFVGIELSPIPFAIARLRAVGRRNVEVRFGDFFRRPLGDAACVVCYLMLRPMARLAAKLDAEVAAGTPVAALGFLFRGRAPEATRRVPAVFPMEVALYRWEPRRAS
jgi:SAM-dependent methyltransferase